MVRLKAFCAFRSFFSAADFNSNMVRLKEDEAKLNDLGDKIGKISNYLTLLEGKLESDPDAKEEYKKALTAYTKLMSEYEPISKRYGQMAKDFPYYIPRNDVNILSKETHIPLSVFGTLNNSILGKGALYLAGNPDFKNYQPSQQEALVQSIMGLLVDSPLFAVGGAAAKGITNGVLKVLGRLKLSDSFLESLGRINQAVIEDISKGMTSREAYQKAFSMFPSDALKVKSALKATEAVQSGVNLGAYNAVSNALNQLDQISKATPGSKVKVF